MLLYDCYENENVIYDTLFEGVSNYKGAYIALEDLYTLVENKDAGIRDNLNLPDGYTCFERAVKRLVREEKIIPLKNSDVNNLGLHLKYKRVSHEKDYSGVRSEIVRCLKKPVSVDYYLAHPAEYIEDRQYIKIISDFLQKDYKDYKDSVSISVSINERSYQLFGDEKFLKDGDKNRGRGEGILKKLGLDWGNLGCFVTNEPFFCFLGKGFNVTGNRQVYIIENKDTFWSFKKLVHDTGAVINADMVIYGEGAKILSSFRFIEEYGLGPTDEYFYFGDIDPEGINIYCDLAGRYSQYSITPFVDGYGKLIEIADCRGYFPVKKKQEKNIENMNKFIDFFDPDKRVKILDVLMKGLYVPQEALSFALMKEFYDVR